ncbi:hypothetical protein [Stenotrophomonas sp. MMGLT7]|uniref:hypothetical protein n=1 Tax=Stenotrophomonas sp. MMGLT7 TaxID=2901227 RepID=UPI001E61C586|nr:hypothetical protein [Stenotrophomonas sp. MMGLT7]MCD7097427.1 hypothetical protein [Stenotrophomonas sp. MMGLT7]
MNPRLLLLSLLLGAGAASAQSTDAAAQPSATEASAAALDLSVPQAPIQYRSDPTYSQDPPGTFYGDKSGKVASAEAAQPSITAEDVCQGKLHGSVTTGIGYSKRGGNSNWQGANLNSCKTYYDDDGKPHQIGISISVGRSDGPGFYGPGPGWGGHPPFGW